MDNETLAGDDVKQPGRYQAFIREIVRHLGQPELPNTLSPTERVMSAKNITDAFLDTDDGLDLSAENAMKLAAIIAASAATDA